jgi:serine phosphatase RsbU (regulator of sigma subunit)
MEENSEKPFFILYRPKDIVSGDFYFALAHKTAGRENERFYLCTADCTGHGVPGAFMSMLNISYLNEAIIERNISKPNEILDHIRSEIITSLNPEGSEEESKDGMDCSLCAYDFKKMEMEFSAANNPVWIVRDKTVIECKPDKMPVGKYHDTMNPFTFNKVDIKKGDVVYTFTDGYADQFGGPKGKKFKYKQLEELLLSIHEKDMDEQKKILNDKFENWKGNLEQVDDVLVIGIKI